MKIEDIAGKIKALRYNIDELILELTGQCVGACRWRE